MAANDAVASSNKVRTMCMLSIPTWLSIDSPGRLLLSFMERFPTRVSKFVELAWMNNVCPNRRRRRFWGRGLLKQPLADYMFAEMCRSAERAVVGPAGIVVQPRPTAQLAYDEPVTPEVVSRPLSRCLVGNTGCLRHHRNCTSDKKAVPLIPWGLWNCPRQSPHAPEFCQLEDPVALSHCGGNYGADLYQPYEILDDVFENVPVGMFTVKDYL